MTLRNEQVDAKVDAVRLLLRAGVMGYGDDRARVLKPLGAKVASSILAIVRKRFGLAGISDLEVMGKTTSGSKPTDRPMSMPFRKLVPERSLHGLEMFAVGVCEPQDGQNLTEICADVLKQCALDFWKHSEPGSVEFMLGAQEGGEPTVLCADCGYRARVETAEYVIAQADANGASTALSAYGLAEMAIVATPEMRTVDEVARFLGVDQSDIAKILFYRAERPGLEPELVAALLPGDRVLSERKLRAYLGAVSVDKPTSEEVMRQAEVPVGSAGPVGLSRIRLLVDPAVAGGKPVVVGANLEGHHFVNAQAGRDFRVDEIVCLAEVKEGDRCARCGGELNTIGGYAAARVVTGLDREIQARKACCFIDITAIIAALVDRYHDTDGICWPVSVAPFALMVLCINKGDSLQRDMCERIYADARAMGISVLYDDRDQRAGVKFKDADLLGTPYRVTVGRKASAGVVELVERSTKTMVESKAKDVISQVQSLLGRHRIFAHDQDA